MSALGCLKKILCFPTTPVAQIENAPVRSLIRISVEIFFGYYGICLGWQAGATT